MTRLQELSEQARQIDSTKPARPDLLNSTEQEARTYQVDYEAWCARSNEVAEAIREELTA